MLMEGDAAKVGNAVGKIWQSISVITRHLYSHPCQSPPPPPNYHLSILNSEARMTALRGDIEKRQRETLKMILFYQQVSAQCMLTIPLDKMENVVDLVPVLMQGISTIRRRKRRAGERCRRK